MARAIFRSTRALGDEPTGCARERIQKIPRRAEALRSFPRESLLNDAGDRLRHAGVVQANVVDVLHADRDDDLLVRPAGVGSAAGEALVKDRSDGPQVRPSV